MPEGDTVWRAARRLDRALAGQVLVTSDFRVPQLATADLSGFRVLHTASRGKHLLTHLEGTPDHPGPPLTLHTHLRMEGSWQVHPPGARWRRPVHEARVVLITAERVAVGFSLGILELLPRGEEDRAVGHLGPDLLGADWDEEEALRRTAADPARPVGEALLDQRNLAGIGNVYRAELCFVAGVHPARAVGEVPDLRRMLRRARAMLEANKERTERTTTGDLRRGRRLWVYGRAGEPCRRCGTTIEGAAPEPGTTQRSSYWCPHCQPS